MESNKVFYDLTKTEGNIKIAQDAISGLVKLATEQRLNGDYVSAIDTEVSIAMLQTKLDFYIADNFLYEVSNEQEA